MACARAVNVTLLAWRTDPWPHAVLLSLISTTQSRLINFHVSPEDGIAALELELLDTDARSLVRRGALSSAHVRTCGRQLIRAVAHCHSCDIVHRDIKPGNFLLNTSGRVKLADFGLSRVLPSWSGSTTTLSNDVVSLWYRAPELLLGSDNYSLSIDVWSVGCVLVELATGRPLFDGKTVEE